MSLRTFKKQCALLPSEMSILNHDVTLHVFPLYIITYRLLSPAAICFTATKGNISESAWNEAKGYFLFITSTFEAGTCL